MPNNLTINFFTLLCTFGTMSLEIIVFFKTRPFGKYMYSLPSLEIKDKN